MENIKNTRHYYAVYPIGDTGYYEIAKFTNPKNRDLFVQVHSDAFKSWSRDQVRFAIGSDMLNIELAGPLYPLYWNHPERIQD